MNINNTEIERKWLCSGFPSSDLPLICEFDMRQGYISFDPAVRIRSSANDVGTEYWLTIKGGGGLMRTEVELPLSEAQFNSLGILVAGASAAKRCRHYRLPDGEVLECSIVDEGEPTAFYYAEIEFPSLEAAEAFVPPSWLGREVSDDPAYTMSAYCRRKVRDQTSKPE